MIWYVPIGNLVVDYLGSKQVRTRETRDFVLLASPAPLIHNLGGNCGSSVHRRSERTAPPTCPAGAWKSGLCAPQGHNDNIQAPVGPQNCQVPGQHSEERIRARNIYEEGRAVPCATYGAGLLHFCGDRVCSVADNQDGVERRACVEAQEHMGWLLVPSSGDTLQLRLKDRETVCPWSVQHGVEACRNEPSKGLSRHGFRKPSVFGACGG